MRITRDVLVFAVAGAALAALAALPAAAQEIPVGHLADYSGPTSDVGTPYGQGVSDTIAYINANGGIGGRKIDAETVDYSYQVPRAVSTYKGWSGRVVAIQGWGTADTEALVAFVGKDKIPYYSASYSAALTDPAGGSKADKPAPYNFFYGPSYSDAARAMVQWAAEDWKRKGGKGKPKYVHMGADHPYPNAPKQAGANYAYLGNTAGSNISVLKACHAAGVKVQFLGNVWGMDENAMKAAGAAADGVVFPLRTGAVWNDDVPGMKLMKGISKMSDPSGNAYRAIHYLAGACTVLYMKEAMEWAAGNGGITGENIKKGMESRKNWVPQGSEGVCKPSTWSAKDHRSMLEVDLYRAGVKGSTEASVPELIANGTITMTRIAIIQLPRKQEWLGW